ncbi:MAG TPA: DUF3108 domain-containing protein [Lysobacter sp.]|nr:DUF3108 domain-containing protein [Lysobacter sp.]
MFRRVRLPLLMLALLIASAPAWALKPFTADYVASYMGMTGQGRMTLAREGNRWRYTLNVRNQVADLSQSTVFEERDDQWRPLSGSDSSLLLVKKTNKNATYDWARGVATWSGDVKADRAGPIALKPGDLDALLVNLALVRDVAAGKPLRYRMVEDGRVKQLVYTVAGHETIQVDGKPMRATKVVNQDGKKRITAWIVDGLPVPARIVQQRKDETLELQVQQVR